MRPRIYSLTNARMPWGDYGNILAQGMLASQAGHRLIQIERTGPFVPPISFPSGCALVVTATTKARLQKSSLTGFRFLRANKQRIVELRWEDWDQTQDRPPRIPLGGEPENYILRGRHSESLSKEMGELFELRPRCRLPWVRCGVELKWGSEWPILRPSFHHWRGDDFFYGERGSTIFVTTRAKSWLARAAREWVHFEPAQWG